MLRDWSVGSSGLVSDAGNVGTGSAPFSPKILTKSFSLAFFKSLTDKGRFSHLAGTLYEQNIFIRSTVRDELKNS